MNGAHALRVRCSRARRAVTEHDGAARRGAGSTGRTRPVDPAIVTADNTFGLNLFQNLNSGATGNVAIAPISVAMALQIVYNGAGGATQQGMAQTLQLGSLSTQDLNNDNAALQGSLLNPDPQVNLIDCQFAVDASGHQSAARGLHPNGPDVLRSHGRATCRARRTNVNNWVSTETDGLITNILPRRITPRWSRSSRMSSISKANGARRSIPARPLPRPSPWRDGTQVSVPDDASMRQLRLFAGRQLPGGPHSLRPGALEHAGGDAGFQHQLEQFRRRPHARRDQRLGEPMQTAHGSLAMPKFTATYGASLLQPLSSSAWG